MKKWIAFVLIAAMLLTVTGCHKAKLLQPFQAPQQFDETRTYEITFWAKNENNVNQQAVYKQAVADFEKLYPNIKVHLKMYSDYGQIYSDVITNIATDSTPNVCITYPDHIATYLEGKNTVVPLDELMAHPAYGLGGSELRYDGPTQEELVPEFLSECVVDGNQYALPYMRSTEACYVNVDYVEALGYEMPEVLTWDFVWEVSEKAMEKNPDGTFKLNGQNTLIPFIYKSTDNMMISILEQTGAGYSTEKGEVLIFNDTTQAVLEDVYQHSRTRAFSTFSRSGYPANFLNAGQCIFAVDSTAGATWMGCDAPLMDISEENLHQFETVVRPIPQADPDNIKMISQGPSMCVFNKEDPQEVLASWLFAQFLLTNEIQIAYSQTEGYVPVTLKAQESPEYQDYLSRKGEDNQLYYQVKLDTVQLLLNNTDKTFVTPVFNGSADLRQAAGHLIEEVTKSGRGKIDADRDYYNDLYDNTAALYHLDGLSNKSMVGTKADLGPLPGGAIALLAGLGGVWLLLGGSWIYSVVQKKRKESKEKL